MKTINAIIIEDEIHAAKLIETYLNDFSEINLLKICNDGFTGLKAIQEMNPDLIFLDVQMPKLTGFELLELLEEPPAIIFTTAFDEYAIKAFEMNAVDYLMKPFSRERFAGAVKKAMERVSVSGGVVKQEAPKTLQELMYPADILERIVVKKNDRIIVIPAANVTHIEAYDDYVFIHAQGQKHLKQKTMKYYEEHLDPKKFIRIHRSWIVNVECIEQILLWEKDTYMVKLKSGEELRASRAGYKRLKEIF
jgi:two-component system, LytTR family, response regulator